MANIAPETSGPITGAKAVVLMPGRAGERLVALRRDTHPGLPWPGAWDLLGGGCEPGETPRAALLREIAEESGIDARGAETLWKHTFPASDGNGLAWFAVLRLPAPQPLHLGDEGTALALMTPAAYAAHPGAVTPLAQRVRLWLNSAPSAPA